MTRGWFEQFTAAEAGNDQKRVAEGVKAGGYPAFHPIVEGFNSLLRSFADHETGWVELLLQRGRQLFPEPVTFSPSWEKLWDELEQVSAFKKHALTSVSETQRDGEWQVVMDNPYTHLDVVCYPALTFLEAAYLYGYFRQQLEKNEYIRLQKIQTLIINYGS